MSTKHCVRAPYRHPFFRLMNLVVHLAPLQSKKHQNNLLFQKDLHADDPAAKPEPKIPGFEFTRLQVSDAALLARFQDALPADDYRRRLEGGHTGFCAKINGDIAGYNWVALDRACHMFGSAGEHLTFPLPKGTAFIYDFFVFRDYRGRGIGPMIKRGVFEHLKSRGFQYALCCIDFWNTSAIKIALGMGCEPVGFEHVYRIGSWRKWFLGTPAETRRLALWCRQFEEVIN